MTAVSMIASRRPAMGRTPRHLFWSESAAHHLMDRGHNRQTIFLDDEDRAAFLSLLGHYRQRFQLRLFHYCLMTNHFHLLVQLPDPRQLSRLMAGLLRAYVHHVHRRYQFLGHLWQGRFKSPAVQGDPYWLSCGRYIERNPLEAGLVAEPWQFRWSSAPAYALGREDPLVDENPWYRELSTEGGRRQALWRDFLLGEDPREEDIRQGAWAIGDAAFHLRLEQERGRPVRRRRGRPRKPTSVPSHNSPQLKQ
jgi:putative transposase